jgi:ribosomal protein S27AE
MLPERPRGFGPCASGVTIPQRGADTGAARHAIADVALEPPPEHHQQICPTCGNRLTGHRCKLICARCGYYMSCADYY